MKIPFRHRHVLPLLLLSLCSAQCPAQSPWGPPTTFENLYSRSDFIGLIKITDKRYDEIPYLDQSGETRQTIATIYKFKILDEIKRKPNLPNEFVSMGGKYESGFEIRQTHELYFEKEETIFVHLAKNELLFGQLRPVGINPGGPTESTFVVIGSGNERRLSPYVTKGRIPANPKRPSGETIDAKARVISRDRSGIDYIRLKNLYRSLEIKDEEKIK